MRRVSTALVTSIATSIAIAAALASCSSSTKIAATTTVTGTAPADIGAPTTSAAAPITPTPTTDAPSTYKKVGAPTVPDKTAPIDAKWVDPGSGTLTTDLPDGVYWGDVASAGESDSKFVSFDLSQALFGATCTATLGTGDDACNDDIGIVADPHGEFPAFLPDLKQVTVVDEAQQSYAVDPQELWNLASEKAPSTAAPAGFTYQPFPYLVTVRGGKVVSVQQVWTP